MPSQVSFALGLECSDLVVAAFERAKKESPCEADQDPWDAAETYLRVCTLLSPACPSIIARSPSVAYRRKWSRLASQSSG